MEYKYRFADDILKNKLQSKGAVLVEGAKWCGKSTTSARIANTVIYMQDPATKERNFWLATSNTNLFFSGKTPILIDEWQLVPSIWDSVRFEVDKRGLFGQFILTGSATPPNTDQIFHSGVGRITKLTMRPMSLFESKDSNGSVLLSDLFLQKQIYEKSMLNIHDIAFLTCRGGWPLSLNDDKKIALAQAIDYYDGVVNMDINKVDGIKRKKETAELLLRSYARNISTQVSLQTILADMQFADYTFSPNTISSYLEALKKIFVIEESLSWNPNLRSKAAIRTSNTRYFTDPSIACAALGLGPENLINDLNTFGLIFENLCIRDLRVYAEVNDGTVYHYRDKTGLECDAVVALRNGKYGLIEIKLGGPKQVEEGAKNLNKLESLIDDTRMEKPSFKMVLTAIDDIAYQRQDKVYVVPIGCLSA